jgi:ferredoxin
VTKEEAKEILADMHKKGYVHNVLYMFGKKSGAFVMCNCDREVCAVVKGTRILGPGINCEKGPEVIKRDRSKCLGAQECGMCVKRCPFGANKIKDGMVIFDKEKCMGCELCVATCKGCARELEERKDYGYDEVMHRELLLAGKYGRPELDTVTLEDNNREE